MPAPRVLPRHFPSAPIAAVIFLSSFSSSSWLTWFVESRRFRVVIYRATPSGIAAALSAATLSSSFPSSRPNTAPESSSSSTSTATGCTYGSGTGILVIEPTAHVGGMATEGGIGFRDAKSDELRLQHANTQYQWGRLNAKYYNSQKDKYYDPIELVWQPDHWVGEASFLTLLNESGVELLLNHDLLEGTDGVQIDICTPRRIHSVVLENGTVIEADYFIDASYTGDLMRAAGVDTTFGRESADTYHEPWGGVTNYSASQFKISLNPIDDSGDYKSVLHPISYVRVGEDPNTHLGASDTNLMAYSYRVCLSKDPAIAVPVTPPADYNPFDFELARRLVQSELLNEVSLSEPWLHLDYMGFPRELTSDGHDTMKYDACCGWSPMGIDAVGLSLGYANASRQERLAMEARHRYYVQGLLWFWRTDPAVPIDVRRSFAEYGLCNDSWVDNGHFPRQLYVREASRLVGDQVFTQHDRNEECKPDSIAVGNWGLDVHDMQRVAFYQVDESASSSSSSVVPNGTWRIMNEGLRGDVEQQGGVFPFEIPYWTILPKREQVSNLAVVSCPSFSHVAFAAVRVEPTLWTLGQAAGTAAAMASNESLFSLHDVNVARLQQALIDQGVIIHWPYGRTC